jgi:hypothetical protein
MTLKDVLLWLVGMHRPATQGQRPIPNPQSPIRSPQRPPPCPICKGRPLGPIECDCGECDFLLNRACPFCGGTGVVPRTLLRAYQAAAASQAQPPSPDFRLEKVAKLVRSYHEAAKGN